MSGERHGQELSYVGIHLLLQECNESVIYLYYYLRDRINHTSLPIPAEVD